MTPATLRVPRWAFGLLCAAAVVGTARANVPPRYAAEVVRPECIAAAARHHRVNEHVLAALAWHESRYNSAAVGRNTDGSVDIGAFQINSVHLPQLRRHGVDERHLFDPCLSAYVAAWHYARQIRDLGNSWEAVGAYHSRTPARQRWYANQIAAVLMRWGVLPRAPLPFAPATTLAPGQKPKAPPPAAPRAAAAVPGSAAAPAAAAARSPSPGAPAAGPAGAAAARGG